MIGQPCWWLWVSFSFVGSTAHLNSCHPVSISNLWIGYNACALLDLKMKGSHKGEELFMEKSRVMEGRKRVVINRFT
jgi:hypothetical protein